MIRLVKTAARGFASKVVEPQRNPRLPTRKLFINNEWVDSVAGDKFTTVNPTTGEVICEISRGQSEDVDIAVNSARRAFDTKSTWRTMDASQRGILINRLADLIERDAVYLSSLESFDVGKVFITVLKGDLVRSVGFLRYAAGYADKCDGATFNADGDYFAYTKYEPVGVSGLIAAWNFPLMTAIWKIGAVLATGCTAVYKPSQHSTLSSLHLAELIKEAGIPPGVINIVPGMGDVGDHLSKHPHVDKISFTGSTPIGQRIYRHGADNMKRLTLELGGKSPNIILADADVDKAVEHALYAGLHNMGQCCCAGSRTFVHESIYEEFVKKAVDRIKQKKIGDPMDADVDHGPQAQEQITQMFFRSVNIPYHNMGFSRFRTHTFKDWPSDLSMVMANARRLGN